MPDRILVTDMDVFVFRDQEIYHVMLRIGDNDYDITELVYDNLAVQAAIESLKSIRTGTT